MEGKITSDVSTDDQALGESGRGAAKDSPGDFWRRVQAVRDQERINALPSPIVGPGEAGAVSPWDFTYDTDVGGAATALALDHRLLGAGDRQPMLVLAIVLRHVQCKLRVDSPEFRPEAQAAAAMGLASGRSTYPAKNALRAAARWRTAGIAEANGLVADAKVGLRGGSRLLEDAVLKVLVARPCRLAATTVTASR